MKTQIHAEISTLEDGSIQAISPELQLLILPEEDSKAKAFNRNGLKKQVGMSGFHHIRWLVGELDGVRCYIQGSKIILTKRDLYP